MLSRSDNQLLCSMSVFCSGPFMNRAEKPRGLNTSLPTLFGVPSRSITSEKQLVGLCTSCAFG
jgi:hypothetical protein